MKILQTHTVQFWEPSETKDAYGRVERAWERVGTVTDAEVQHRTQRQQPIGPGDAPVGDWKVYTAPGYMPHAEMVVEVLTGPNAYRLLKIEDDYYPRGRLVQLTCSQWHGTLGEVS
jgi:hypothetical protein